jgi:hypothetical protein
LEKQADAVERRSTASAFYNEAALGKSQTSGSAGSILNGIEKEYE